MQLESNMAGYQVMGHNECVAAIIERKRKSSRWIGGEVKLPNGKIADALALSAFDTITIWEVKSRWRVSELIEAWDKYSWYADYLWFVSLALADADWNAFSGQSAWPSRAAAAGVLSYLGGSPRVFRLGSRILGDQRARAILRHRILCGEL